MNAEDSRTIGRRLREVRYWRGKSLRVVAELAGISEGYLSRLEWGERPVDRRSLIVSLANALQVAPTELIGQPAMLDDRAMAEAQATIPAVRLALVGARLGGGEPVTERAVPDLAAETERIVELRTACDFASLGAALPSLLTDLYAATGTTHGDDRQTVLECLARALNSAMTLAHVFGYSDLAYMLAEHSYRASLDLGTGWSTVARIAQVHALLPIGAQDQAHRLAVEAAEVARSSIDRVGVEDGLAAYGALLMAAALAAKRRPDAEAALAEAAQVAARTGETGADVSFFGETNLGMYRMAAALEAGEPDRAASLSRQVNPERIPSQERRAKHWLDTGRALAQLRGREWDAVVAFRRSEQLAPLRLYANPYARETIADLLRRARREAGGRELRGLAYRMGIGVG